MNCPPGFAIVSVSENAWAVMARRKVRHSYWLDLYKYVEMWLPKNRGGQEIWGYRRHVVEPAPQLTYAICEGLKILEEEGLGARYRRNMIAGRALREAIRAMGLELYPRGETDASNTVTAIMNPEGFCATEVVEVMRKECGVVIAGALEEVAGKVLRIGHMSAASTPIHILYAIEALELAFSRLGLPITPQAGIYTALSVFRAANSRGCST
jgi:aspartate aminotransferase-like enzyme